MTVVATLAALAGAGAAQGETVVTTYVVKTQEERRDTRWTLTEWLRIKERMKMMDVWLAMFSDPNKDRFRPELNLSYGVTRGDLKVEDGAGATDSGATSGTQGRAQLWLTNLVSGTVGIRTLNIDLGGEAFQRASLGLPPVAALPGATTPVDGEDRDLKHTYYTGNLRIFGKNIQDSSLILKYGQYQSENRVPSWNDPTEDGSLKGMVAGAELQLYLFKWLGFEGNYLQYGDGERIAGSDDLSGTYYDYTGFVEISLLRLMAGRYREDWSFANGGNKTDLVEEGLIGGMKLQF
jgi:hypothetical protein